MPIISDEIFRGIFLNISCIIATIINIPIKILSLPFSSPILKIVGYIMAIITVTAKMEPSTSDKIFSIFKLLFMYPTREDVIIDISVAINTMMIAEVYFDFIVFFLPLGRVAA